MEFSPEELQPVLKLIEEQSLYAQTYRANIEELLNLYKKIFHATPVDEKFTKIRLDKARTKLWSKAPAMEEFMLATGWSKQNDHMRFSDKKNLRATIDFLAQERMRLRPSDRDWVSATKVENITPANASDPREERLREEAAKKRDAEYAACLHDIEQRKILNELIKREILADIEHRRIMSERNPES